MADEKFFLHPRLDWQRRYEALRASFIERQPAKIVADRFGYSTGYIHLLRHQFTHDKIDFSEPVFRSKKLIEEAFRPKLVKKSVFGASAICPQVKLSSCCRKMALRYQYEP